MTRPQYRSPTVIYVDFRKGKRVRYPARQPLEKPSLLETEVADIARMYGIQQPVPETETGFSVHRKPIHEGPGAALYELHLLFPYHAEPFRIALICDNEKYSMIPLYPLPEGGQRNGRPYFTNLSKPTARRHIRRLLAETFAEYYTSEEPERLHPR